MEIRKAIENLLGSERVRGDPRINLVDATDILTHIARPVTVVLKAN